ncbi:MAG: DNA methyltransferase, partial [Patescibacteria group bacterium]
FNNMFASYKGEGTGAVRHMFSHHILKPERAPIEANVWGTSKSSGSFSNLFRNRIDRAIAYRRAPTEVTGENGTKGVVCSSSFTGEVESEWPNENISLTRKTYLSCGDSSVSRLPTGSIDLVITDPPFFDNVHYSELADFFYAWQRLVPRGFIKENETTRSTNEVQDSNPVDFANKLQAVFQECNRVLKDNGLLVFTYHHSRDEGWRSVANAILNAGFTVVNAHPVKSEMSVATPKSQASEPIQLDMVIVCRKDGVQLKKKSPKEALGIAKEKIDRLESSGFSLSKNDKKVIMYGQLLASMQSTKDVVLLPSFVAQEMAGAVPLPF